MPDRRLPAAPDWMRSYDRATLADDALAALIVTLMLIPQSLAYAILAGLPPQAGIYASIVPILLYALLGSSRVLAVGPVAVISLMTASAVGGVAAQGTADYAAAALTLALLSGVILLALGVLRLGMLANFLSHPVISGFITASGILIAVSQLKDLLGVPSGGHTLPEMLAALVRGLGAANLWTAAIGLTAVGFLVWVRRSMKRTLIARGVRPRLADMATKAGPVAAVVVSTLAVTLFGLDARGVAVVGDVPRGLPPLTTPPLTPELIRALFLPAVLISIIGFVESISVAETLAARRRQRIAPNRELIALGAANIGAAFSGGYPVTGGFARSVVNADAGARTQAAGAMTAAALALSALLLTPLVHDLPRATLAATIIVAVLSLVDLSILRKTWRYARSDFVAVAATIVLTLLLGVETGVASGVVLSILLHLYKTSRPHVAEVGLMPGTEHFRNIDRHAVATQPHILSLRIDESLYFVNTRFLEEMILHRLDRRPEVTDVVLICSAVNAIDFSALETLEEVNRQLTERGVRLHLSEIKGPVMDRLARTRLLRELSGKVYLSQHQAWTDLTHGRK